MWWFEVYSKNFLQTGHRKQTQFCSEHNCMGSRTVPESRLSLHPWIQAQTLPCKNRYKPGPEMLQSPLLLSFSAVYDLLQHFCRSWSSMALQRKTPGAKLTCLQSWLENRQLKHDKGGCKLGIKMLQQTKIGKDFTPKMSNDVQRRE